MKKDPVNESLSFVITQLSNGVPDEQILQHLESVGVGAEVAELLFLRARQRQPARYSYGFQNVTIMHRSTSGKPAKLFIGSFCSIADQVKINLGAYHRTDWVTTYPFGHINRKNFPHHGIGHPTTRGNVIIGNDVWLATRCTIMSGVTVGDGAVIAANAHVVKDVGPYEIVGGNPARLIKRRFTEKQIEALLQYKWWELSDECILKLVPYLCSDDIDMAIQKIKEMRDSHPPVSRPCFYVWEPSLNSLGPGKQWSGELT